uniref:Uncharacterized protein n=1 Tax=Arundo donax TaxID=35708 RepID=A0A0A9FXT7_ARUDO
MGARLQGGNQEKRKLDSYPVEEHKEKEEIDGKKQSKERENTGMEAIGKTRSRCTTRRKRFKYRGEG